MKCFVHGAGVVGQVYAGRLAEAGHEVTLLARGDRLRPLHDRTVVLRSGTARSDVKLHDVVGDVPDGHHDVAILAVRADQIEGALETLGRVAAGTVLTLCNTHGLHRAIEQVVGSERLVPGFPGLGAGNWPTAVLNTSWYRSSAPPSRTGGTAARGRSRGCCAARAFP